MPGPAPIENPSPATLRRRRSRERQRAGDCVVSFVFKKNWRDALISIGVLALDSPKSELESIAEDFWDCWLRGTLEPPHPIEPPCE